MEQANITAICRCGKPHDGWPDGKGGELCQMCWEEDCSASWWKAVEMNHRAIETNQHERGEEE